MRQVTWRGLRLAFAVAAGVCPLYAAQVADLSRDGIDITVDAEPDTVDPGRDFFVTVTVKSPAGQAATLSDLRTRFQGFQVAEDFTEDPLPDADGRTKLVSRWRLVPEPMAKKYRLAPFVVNNFYTAPVLFAPPSVRPSATGDMEVEPKRDLPSLSWKLVLCALCSVLCALAVVCTVWLIVRKIRTMVRIHRMSPVERAMYELEQLLKKGLPRRGFYKDFYVELTMVVRRYVQRQHNVRAPNLTTEEFFDKTRNAPTFPKSTLDLLIDFLRKADLVKFAGVTATEENASAAASSARAYVIRDDEIVREKMAHSRQKDKRTNLRIKK